MASYDRSVVSQSIRDFIQNPNDLTKGWMFKQILIFGQVSATAYIRPFWKYWSAMGHDFIAEDMVSEFSFKFYELIECDRFDGSKWMAKPMAFLNTFARSRFKDVLKSEMAKLEKHERVDVTAIGWSQTEGKYLTPDQELEVAEEAQAVTTAIRRLPASIARVVHAKKQGKKSSQVAIELGIPVSEVYEATRRAKELLRV